MKNKENIMILIPARGGSKTVKKKNLFLLNGKPLIYWTIKYAMRFGEVNKIFVSSDDNLIISNAKKLGVQIHKRPSSLATDSSLVVDTIKHFYNSFSDKMKPDIIILLEPTCPLRKPSWLINCLNRMYKEKLDSIATFSLAETNPERCWHITKKEVKPLLAGSIPWMPRQKLRPVYKLNGAIYAFRPKSLPKKSPTLLYGKYAAEIIDGSYLVDIDDEKDFIIANALFKSSKFSFFK